MCTAQADDEAYREDGVDNGLCSVYILSCANGSFYVGMTNDLERRIAEHRARRGSKWVARRLPVEVVFCLDGLGWHDAREVERYIKTLSRARKQALIDGDTRMMGLVERQSSRRDE